MECAGYPAERIRSNETLDEVNLSGIGENKMIAADQELMVISLPLKYVKLAQD